MARRLTQKIASQMTSCAAYRSRFAAKSPASWSSDDHFFGVTAIQRIVEPLTKNSHATRTIPTPSQIAHQSSFS
jgi:hypothetical protein